MDEPSEAQKESLPAPTCSLANNEQECGGNCNSNEHLSVEEENFEIASNVTDEPINYEKKLYHCSDSMVTEEEEEDEKHSDAETLANDYLDMENEDMLKMKVDHFVEPDVRSEDAALTCTYPECSFTTNDSEIFFKHGDRHLEETSFQCDICSMKFSDFSNMRRHRISHTGQKLYECRQCSKKYIRKELLIEHFSRQHTKQKPYRCPFCIKCFKLRPQLKLHLSSEHSAFLLNKACEICGFEAASTNAAKNHFSICHLKQSPVDGESSECIISQNHLISSENNAIDLGAVSQNFSFVPVPYTSTPYTISNDSNRMPGPSDLSRLTTRVVHTNTPKIHNLTLNVLNKDACTSDPMDQTTRSRVSSLASSTTTVSPNNCRGASSHKKNVEYLRDHATNQRAYIKSEPPELTVEDSQNGCVLPTSTMEMTSVVETSHSSEDIVSRSLSPSVLPKKRVKSTSGNEGENLERYTSPSGHENTDGSDGEATKTAAPFKVQSGQSSNGTFCQHCTSEAKHLRFQGSTNWAKRRRDSESNSTVGGTTEPSTPPSQPCSETRVLRNKATSTDFPLQPVVSRNSGQYVASHNNTSHASNQTEDSCMDDKSQLIIQKVESSSLTCPYCEIVFPDQTLYFLHRSLHTDSNPWKCNLCGKHFKDKYEFNAHLIGQGHH